MKCNIHQCDFNLQTDSHTNHSDGNYITLFESLNQRKLDLLLGQTLYYIASLNWVTNSKGTSRAAPLQLKTCLHKFSIMFHFFLLDYNKKKYFNSVRKYILSKSTQQFYHCSLGQLLSLFPLQCYLKTMKNLDNIQNSNVWFI